jgi:hypothetical protein
MTVELALFRRIPSRPAIGLKDLFDGVAEYARNREGQWKTGVISPRFDRVNRLTRHVQTLCEIRLRPAMLRS